MSGINLSLVVIHQTIAGALVQGYTVQLEMPWENKWSSSNPLTIVSISSPNTFPTHKIETQSKQLTSLHIAKHSSLPTKLQRNG